jgi:hypothetical protein
VITSELAANLKFQVFLALLQSLKNCANVGYKFGNRELMAAILRMPIDNVFLLEKVTKVDIVGLLEIQDVRDAYLISHD